LASTIRPLAIDISLVHEGEMGRERGPSEPRSKVTYGVD